MRILIVEDETRIAQVIRTALQQQEHEVEWTASGNTGLKLAQAGGFDLVILDIMLPDTDGTIVLRELRRDGNSIAVILLTARDSLEDRVDGLESGADDYLTKPFYIEELLARVKAVFRRKQESVPNILSCGDVALNRTTRDVMVGTTRLNLTTREYCVLELLMRTPGNVFTRTELLDKVWDLQFDPSTNIVDVYVRRLRSKLADAGARNIIETVRGVGYRVDCSRETNE